MSKACLLAIIGNPNANLRSVNISFTNTHEACLVLTCQGTQYKYQFEKSKKNKRLSAL